MIAATIGGAVLVLIAVSICICFYCKHRKQKPDNADDTNRPPDDEVMCTLLPTPHPTFGSVILQNLFLHVRTHVHVLLSPG